MLGSVLKLSLAADKGEHEDRDKERFVESL